jgi:hypothetical protein
MDANGATAEENGISEREPFHSFTLSTINLTLFTLDFNLGPQG